jgi:hypothetical protein
MALRKLVLPCPGGERTSVIVPGRNVALILWRTWNFFLFDACPVTALIIPRGIVYGVIAKPIMFVPNVSISRLIWETVAVRPLPTSRE